MAETYICVICGNTYQKEISDEEALAEARKIFGDIPKEEMVIVCDLCYWKIMHDFTDWTNHI